MRPTWTPEYRDEAQWEDDAVALDAAEREAAEAEAEAAWYAEVDELRRLAEALAEAETPLGPGAGDEEDPPY